MHHLYSRLDPAWQITLIASTRIPDRLQPLLEDGLVDDVIRQLKSGKEAAVYLVRCGREIRCAKVYKEANKRSFRQAVEYREGRKVKNSRRQRAMDKGSRYGRQEKEFAWQSAEAVSYTHLTLPTSDLV